MFTDEVAELVKAARNKGAAEAPAGEKCGEDPLVQKLLDGLKGARTEDGEGKKPGRVVHLVKNLPPLPAKVVERIRDGQFVELAHFPVFEDGPSEAGEWRADPYEETEGRAGGSSRKKAPKEVPDLAGWGTAFTLLQVAWASREPKMWVPLMAYRESIVKIARRYPWQQVARYDRRFRQEAAGKADVRWEDENISLLLDVVHTGQTARGEHRQGAGRSDPGPRRAAARRRGVCYQYSKGEDRCTYGSSCKFDHLCSVCGGDHSAAACRRAGDRK